MEQKIVSKICPGQPVRRIGCNGDSVEISRMCDFIATQIRLMSNRYYPIFIVFDREKRADSRETLRARMIAELQSRGFGDQDIRVFIADREFEDWYLMDVDGIRDHYQLVPMRVRGTGKSGMASLLGQKHAYIETGIGVDIFEIIDKKKISEACGEFRAMMDAGAEIGCLSVGP